MSKKTLLLVGLGIGLAIMGMSGTAQAADPSTELRASAATVRQLQGALTELQITLGRLEAAVAARTAADMANPKWNAMNATLVGIRGTLGGIRTALTTPPGRNIAQAATTPSPSPSSSPSPVVAGVAEINPVPPSETTAPQAAIVSNSGLARKFSIWKILLAALILVGGGGLIAYSLYGSDERPAVIVRSDSDPILLP